MKTLKRIDGKLFTVQESVEFLLAEYEQSFQHLRHYDSTQNTIMTFSITGYAAIFAAAYAFYQYDSQSIAKFLFISLILLLSAIAGILVLSLFSRNRLYYTIVTKQVNSIRNYFLNNSELDFLTFNKSYLNPEKPLNFNPISTYSMYIYLVCILNSSLLGSGIYIFTHFVFGKNYTFSLYSGLGLGFVILVLQLFMVIKYLKRKDTQNADTAVWEK